MKTNILLEEKYHNSMAQFYSNRRLHDYIWEVPEELFLLDKSLFMPGMKVVDMGCGPAISVSRILGKQILTRILYTGVDISKELLKFAKKYIPTGKFVCEDMSNVSFNRNSFDILISFGALHHCEDKDRTLKRWVRLIKPGGLLLLREPIYQYLKKGTGESPIEEGVKVDKLFSFINNNGLKIVKITYFSTNAFHLFNRVMIKLGLKSWQQARFFWYPVVWVDTFLSHFRSISHLFDPQAFTIIIKKT